MKKLSALLYTFMVLSVLFIISCKDTEEPPTADTFPGIEAFLNLDMDELYNYSNPSLPNFYNNIPTNTPVGNQTTNMGATLGRVLFYDKALSINNSTACASCHLQADGFTDTAILSSGFEGGKTGAHSMRLANAQFYQGLSFFWDKRAPSLEAQTTMPIQDAVEMGFDNSNGGIDSLIKKMAGLPYYPELFTLTFGDAEITEGRMQDAMAQFVRSMVSTNSKFDQGFALTFNPNAPGPGQGEGVNFSNFTAQENRGKTVFLSPPQNGGAGCAGCHQIPTFSLAPNSRSNGLDANETTVFKAPSLKNVGITGPYMHDGSLATLAEVVEHYNSGIQDGPALDPRLKPNGNVQRLNLSQADKDALVAFLHTLTDQSFTNDIRFSSPFKG